MKTRIRDEDREFGEAVRRWRAGEGLSLLDLADLLMLPIVQMASIETGVESNYTTQRWPRIMDDLKRLGFRRAV